MRVLFICNTSYMLNTGGYQRVSHLLKAIAAIGEVTLVYPTTDGRMGPDLEALSAICQHVFTFPVESIAMLRDLRLPGPINWAKHKLYYLHPTRSALTQGLRSVEGETLVAELCAQRFDLVWAISIASMQMLPSFLSARVIVDLMDVEHRKLLRQPEFRKIHHMTPLYWLEYLKLRRLERSLPALPYEFTVCSETDKKALGRSGRVWVIPNGTELPPPMPAPFPENREPILLFVGAMFYDPNIDAVAFFARRVLPLIRHEVPDVKFLIVGSEPAPSVQQLHDGRSVMVKGTVPDVAEYLHRAVAVVAPIRFGGGTRIKILEALAYRKPVVSTSIGAEGLDVVPGKHLLVADSPGDFAKACVLLLKDGPLRQRLSEEGYQLVSDHYQWAMIERMTSDIVRGAACPASRGEGGGV